jgi:hypothetical protein
MGVFENCLDRPKSARGRFRPAPDLPPRTRDGPDLVACPPGRLVPDSKSSNLSRRREDQAVSHANSASLEISANPLQLQRFRKVTFYSFAPIRSNASIGPNTR